MRTWVVVGLAGCGTSGGSGLMAVGEPCEEVGASGCSDQGDVLLCVDEAWSLQESCEFGVEECAASKGVAVCSVGGEPCDEEGATKCDDSFTVVQCDGAGWHVYDDCFPDSCSTDAGSASCVAR